MSLRTLRSKLLVFSLLITIVPMLFVYYITYQANKADAMAQIEQTLTQYTQQISRSIEAMLAERISNITLLAQNPVLRNPDSTPQQIREEMQRFVEAYDIYWGSLFVTREGTVLVDTNDLLTDIDLNRRDWFVQAVAGGVLLSDVYHSPVIDRPVLVLAAPIEDPEGNMIGVVSPSIHLTELAIKINSLHAKQTNAGSNGNVFVVNETGDFIAYPQVDAGLNSNYFEQYAMPKETFKQALEGNNIFENEHNETINFVAPLHSFTGFDHQWYTIVSVPKSEVLGFLDTLLIRYLILFSFVLGMIVFAVYKLSDYIVNPVQRLVDVTSDLTFERKVTPLTYGSYLEIDHLNRSFNNMFKKLEERDKSHRQSSLILETTDNGVMVFNRHTGEVTTFNRTCEELFDIPKHEVIGQNIVTVMNLYPKFKTFIEKSQVYDYLQNTVVSMKMEIECELDQQLRWFMISLSSLPNVDQQDDILLVFNELTEKKRMERELIRSERLKVVGEMAAGLAHEIRNPLTTVRGFMQIHAQNQPTENREHHELMLREIDRVNDIVTDLLHLSSASREKYVKTELDVRNLLEEILKMNENEARKKNIQVIQSCVAPAVIVSDPKKLKQVFINLIRNAFEAMPDGGELYISVSASSDQLHIEIRDTGVGMERQTLEKIGTPFYTTKATGTGLGLAISFRVIEDLGGSIRVRSKQGQGSSFTLSLPLRN